MTSAYILNWIKIMKKLGFCLPQKGELKKCLYGIPLLIIPICNLISVLEYQISISVIMSMVVVALIEEIVFRGILLGMLLDYNWKLGVWLSSVIFSALHFLNLLSNKNYVYVFFQVMMAFITGMCFACIVIQTKSIMLGIIMHVMINITGSGIVKYSWIWIFCSIILFGYSCYLYSILIIKVQEKK